MILLNLAPGQRFHARELPSYSGTLIAVSESSATVRLDGTGRFEAFETRDGRQVCIERADRVQRITSMLDVVRR